MSLATRGWTPTRSFDGLRTDRTARLPCRFLVVLSTGPSELVANRNWTRVFGVVRREAIEEWGEALMSVRVWYLDAQEVEFGITGAQSASAGETTLEVLTRGYQALLDGDGLFRTRGADSLGE